MSTVTVRSTPAVLVISLAISFVVDLELLVFPDAPTPTPAEALANPMFASAETSASVLNPASRDYCSVVVLFSFDALASLFVIPTV